METCIMSTEKIKEFEKFLKNEERAKGTVQNYLRHVEHFYAWLPNNEVTKELAALWKEELQKSGYSPSSINAMVAALNKFFCFCGYSGLRIKPLRLQKQMFREERRDLSHNEYDKLVKTARVLGKERLSLLIETICSTGVRVSEVQYLTVEALQAGRAVISLKGKVRVILIPGKLAKKLLQYTQKNKITSGEIFLTRSGKGISRKQIWAEMKALCKKANVAESKVFPHNLRHLFARAFYKVCQDVAKLADVLGHSSIETTRIYLISTGAEHARQLNRLGLIS